MDNSECGDGDVGNIQESSSDRDNSYTCKTLGTLRKWPEIKV